MMRCAVVDDEPLARECLVNYIDKVDFLQLVDTGENPMEVKGLFDNNQIDLLFLDVHMPVMNGIEYLKATKVRPIVILTTAYPSYALEGYELDVLDYLLKPITFNRFFRSISKAKDQYLLKQKEIPPAPTNEEETYFFVRCNQVFEKIYFKEVLYVEAQENYVVIHTTRQSYMVLMPIKRVEELLGQGFLRVHKSYLVAVDKITSVETHQLTIKGQIIPVSRTYRSKVIESVVDERVWKK